MSLFKLQAEHLTENQEDLNLLNEDPIKNTDLNPSEENNNKMTISSSMKKTSKTTPRDLYYDINQIKTFANVKRTISNSKIITEPQIEKLLNDEILFCKIYLDIKKISFIINEIIKRVSIQDLNLYYESFYNSDSFFSNAVYKELKNINEEINETSLSFSIYSSFDIARSNIFYNFLKDFIIANSKTIHKKNLPINNNEKEDLILLNYPIFPMIVPFMIHKADQKTNDKKIDIYQKANYYKCASNPIRTQNSYDKILFLKSIMRNQNKNINIYEYNSLI